MVLYNAFVLSWGLTITQNSIHTISDLDRSPLSDTRSAENDRIGADTDPEYRIDASLFIYIQYLTKVSTPLSQDLRIRIVALHKDGWGYKKFGNTLKPSYSTVARGHTEVFQDGFHSEQALQGSIKEVESLCCASGAEAGFKKTDVWVLPALL